MHIEQDLSVPTQPAYPTDYWTGEAARMLIQDQRTQEDVIDHLTAGGVPREDAEAIVGQLAMAIRDAKISRAKKDMLYGALWCGGGTILTLAHISFIFWGAIVFGAIQFFKGVSRMNGD
ncbi:hypothetical protein [Flaviaesturariibacter terrae]